MENYRKNLIQFLEAKALTGINNSKIGECCNGKRRSAGGYKWKWL